MKKLLLLSLLIMFVFNSCATVFYGTKKTISISSSTENARLYRDGNELGALPYQTDMGKYLKSEYTIEAEGYEPKTINITRSFNLITLLNLTNPIGWGIDLITGAYIKFDNKFYDVELTKKQP